MTYDMEDWLAYFDERAGIREFDGKLPRTTAEALARIEVWEGYHRQTQPKERAP